MSPEPSPLTLQEKRLIRQSFESLQEYSTSVVLLFYGRLFELEPAARGLFKTGLPEQSRKLLDMLTTVVLALDNFEQLRPTLAELGRKHVTYGALPSHYESLRQALLWAMAHALEGGFDRETKAAWDHVLRAISAAMLAGCKRE